MNEFLLLTYKRSEVIREESVKADVAEAQFFVYLMQLALPVCAETQGSVAAADGVFPDVAQRTRLAREVDDKACRHVSFCARGRLRRRLPPAPSPQGSSDG